MEREEYQALRAAILVHFQILSQYNLTTIIATGAILGAAFASKQPTPWLVLAPVVIIVPNAFNIASRSEAVMRIGTYIQIFHEQAPGRSGWETRLYQIASQLGPWGFRATLNRFLYTLVLGGLGLLCVALFLFQPGVSWPLKSGIGAVTVILLAIAEYRWLLVPSRRQKYLDLWKGVLKAEREAGRWQAPPGD